MPAKIDLGDDEHLREIWGARDGELFSCRGAGWLMILSNMRFRFKVAMNLDQSPLAMSSWVGSSGWAVCYNGSQRREMALA